MMPPSWSRHLVLPAGAVCGGPAPRVRPGNVSPPSAHLCPVSLLQLVQLDIWCRYIYTRYLDISIYLHTAAAHYGHSSYGVNLTNWQLTIWMYVTKMILIHCIQNIVIETWIYELIDISYFFHISYDRMCVSIAWFLELPMQVVWGKEALLWCQTPTGCCMMRSGESKVLAVNYILDLPWCSMYCFMFLHYLAWGNLRYLCILNCRVLIIFSILNAMYLLLWGRVLWLFCPVLSN